MGARVSGGGLGLTGRAAQVSPFREAIEAALSQVPRGHVTTYGDIARALGDVRAARAVGAELALNERPMEVPCHRVVMADGSVGEYAFGGPRAKAGTLRAEGVSVTGGRVAGIERLAVRQFDVVPILLQMAKRQEEMAKLVRLERLLDTPRTAIGVDAAYGSAGPVAAACAFDIRTGEHLQTASVPFTPAIPYVPGYLAFREMDGLLAAATRIDEELRSRAVVLVDGQGILHPRRCGIASMVGLRLELPAVGAAKGRLVGTVEASSRTLHGHEAFAVRVEGERRGARLGAKRSGGGAFISPGTGLTVAQAVSLAARLTAVGARSPGPVMAADRACRGRSRST